MSWSEVVACILASCELVKAISLQLHQQLEDLNKRMEDIARDQSQGKSAVSSSDASPQKVFFLTAVMSPRDSSHVLHCMQCICQRLLYSLQTPAPAEVFATGFHTSSYKMNNLAQGMSTGNALT